MENTEGFGEEELKVLNDALEALIQEHAVHAELAESISDMLLNYWYPGITALELIKAVNNGIFGCRSSE